MREIKSLNEIYVSHLLANAFLPSTDDLSVRYIEDMIELAIANTELNF